jgi:uncharacterized protein YjbJ (UPF0337 family)
MNTDILEGKWKQIRGEIRETWGELTDDELDQIAGKRDKLAGILQEKYGWSRDEAERQIDDFLRNYEVTDPCRPTRSQSTLEGQNTIPPVLHIREVRKGE